MSLSHTVATLCRPFLLHRAPDNPHQQIIKRLLALEGDTFIEDTDTAATTTIGQVRHKTVMVLPAFGGDSRANLADVLVLSPRFP